MDLIIWVKTLLTVQKYHGRMIGALGAIVQKRALASMHNGTENDVLTASNDILKMLKRKENLATLSLLTNKALASIQSDSAGFLVRSFFDGISKEQIAKESGVCERTIYRKINTALQEFSSYISGLGYSSQNLNKICGTEQWIMSTYDFLKHDSIQKNAHGFTPSLKEIERQL